MTDDRHIREVAEVISRQLASRPEAADTAEGIANWWLHSQRTEIAPAIVEAALSLLVSRGQLVTAVEPGGRTLYRPFGKA